MAGISFVNIIKKIDWYADWSGPFCLLEISTAPNIYFKVLESRFGKSFSCFLIIYKKGIASAYLPYKELQEVGKHLAKKVSDIKYAKKWAEDFKKAADNITPAFKLNPEEFLRKLKSLNKAYHDYGVYNVATKIVFNYLPQDSSLVKDVLEEARKYSETFYRDNAEMFLKVTDILVSKTKYPKRLILMMTRQELADYQKRGDMPSLKELEERYQYSAIYFDPKGLHVIPKEGVLDIEKFWVGNNSGEIKGTTAYPGKVIGICRIVSDYKKAKINEGDILVTGMTDPHFVPLMKKVAGIVTNGGGLLSHAAIVARELKKPCIIGTKTATNILKEGDLVEVDASAGVVRVLERSKTNLK